MFYRNIIKKMGQWAKRANRKPLILRGARQVGKTTAVKIFSEEFDTFIYLNLELKEDLRIFGRNLSIDDLLQYIFLEKNISPRGNTLIFIDEIQNSPEAVSMMRYFYEARPEYFVVAAGSLLEIMMKNNDISFPVGRVEYLFMYPLTFEEFLMVSGNEIALDIYNSVPAPEFAQTKLLSLFHKYTAIGGMPEIVNNYISSNDITTLKTIFQSLITSYLDDVGKYAQSKSMIPVIRHLIESTPFEAGKRIKFQGFGNSNYKSREIGEALRTLERTMLVKLIYPTTTLKLPAMPDKKKSPKLQFFDTGLLNYSAGLQAEFFKYDDLHSFYKGILAEHIVGQEFGARDMETPFSQLFWVREQKTSKAEVDFLIPCKNFLIPVEIKAGKSGKLRSLHQFINAADHSYAVRMYAGPFGIAETKTPEGKPYKLLNLPYYYAGKIDQYLNWFCSGD